MAINLPAAFTSTSGFKDAASGFRLRGDILFAFGILAILTVLLFPVPTWLLDFLLGISITISVMILMTVLFVEKPLDLSSFPTILLVSTMLRLSLNIASTRLILTHGHEGPHAAGEVISAFGSFVMGGQVMIGVIIFAILTIINFVVITKGSGRIAEVAARFSLDAMPGKQMAIDADLSAGLIEEADARKRRKELEDESTFFGAMDGANKFVRGDAVAGLVITFINFLAGIIIGVAQRELSFSDAVQTYTILTVGDGLVSQIPALVVSIAAGLLVTKSGALGSSDKAVFAQLGSFPHTMLMTASILTFMAIMPGIPAVPFMALASFCAGMSYLIYRKQKGEAASPSATGKTNLPARPGAAGAVSGPQGATQDMAAPLAPQAEDEPISKTLQLDMLKLELGYGLLALINYEKGHRLTEQIKALRKQLAREMGFVMPPVRIQDNMQLAANAYVVKIKDIECGSGDVRPEMLLVMDPAGEKITLPGEETREPTFGLPAMWIHQDLREEALFKNYTVVDPPTVITTHITEIIKENVAELLTYSETQKLLDDLPEDHQKLVADTIPGQMSVGGLQRVLQRLLSEQVSIRDLPAILEAVAEATRFTNSVTAITEHVRARLSRQITHAITNAEGIVTLVTLAPHWEQAFAESLSGTGEEKQLTLPPSKIQEFITNIRKLYDDLALQGEMPALLTSPIIRPYVRSLIERFRPGIPVLSQNEIHAKARIKTLGQLT